MSMAQLSIIKNGTVLREFSFDDSVVLGRGKDCALQLEDQAVSRNHAMFQWSGKQLQVVRKSEFAPLIVNGVECNEAVLKEGDMLSVGPFLVRVAALKAKEITNEVSNEPAQVSPNQSEVEQAEISHAEGQSGTKGEAQSSDPSGEQPPQQSLEQPSGLDQSPVEMELPVEGMEGSPAPISIDGSGSRESSAESEGQSSHIGGKVDGHIGDNIADNLDGDSAEMPDESAKTRILAIAKVEAKLILKFGSASAKEYALDKEEIFIGRAKSCHIVISDKKASRKNTVIKREGARFIVQDLSSVNGTWVNGKQVQTQELSSEDIIKVGNAEFLFKAISADYSTKEKDFLPVLEQEEHGEQGGQVAGIMASNPMGDPMGGAMGEAHVAQQSMQIQPGMVVAEGAGAGMDLQGIPGMAGVPGADAKPKSLIERFKRLPKRTQALGIVFALLFAAWLMEDDTPSIQVNKLQKPKPSISATPSPGASNAKVSASFDALTPDQKKFVENQHALAFEYYKNKDYDKALFEIQKIFTLVSDYEDSREIERYAKEGKRRMDAIEEERRKKEEDEKIKQRIKQLISEATELMNEKHYDQAKEIFTQILAIEPDNVLVEKWTKEIEAYGERLKEEKRQKEIQAEINKQAWKIYGDAVQLKKKGKYFSAIATFQKVLGLGAADHKILPLSKEMIRKCHVAIRNLRTPVLQQAKEDEEAGHYIKAFSEYKKATHIDPYHPAGYAGMNRIKGILQERAKILYTEAILAESYSDFATAEQKFKECLEVAPQDDIYHQRAERKLSRYFKKEDQSGHIDQGTDHATNDQDTDKGASNASDSAETEGTQSE